MLSYIYKDTEVFKGLVNHPNASKIKEEIILNEFNILLKRGIKGLYLYVYGEKLRDKLLEIKNVL
ncbi:DNA/RNA helicase domain-containing protein [Bacillus thuringiensis]|uniref:DNA/RNA helicase domain-containing protein n=1 Tax=Bacillus thuringiensis TaxID=1428 RepID=UPI0030FE2805